MIPQGRACVQGLARDEKDETIMTRAPQRWLVEAERQAWEPLLRLLAPKGVTAGPEIGEGFRVIESDQAIDAAAFAATGVARWCHPVQLVTTWEHAALSEILPQASALIAFPTRRHGRHGVARVSAAFAKRLGPAPDRVRDLPPGATVLAVAADAEQIFAGTLLRSELLAPRPAGFGPDLGFDLEGSPPPEVRAPSRAGAKLEEAWGWVDWLGERVPRTGRWLELGAFPGGMTAMLARHASAVVAVDLREAPPGLGVCPHVTWIAADITELMLPESEAPFDGIVCDVNGPPIAAARAVARLASKALKPGALVIHTVKLPRWEDHPKLSTAAQTVLAEAGIRTMGLRHLGPNRQELTLVGRYRTLTAH